MPGLHLPSTQGGSPLQLFSGLLWPPSWFCRALCSSCTILTKGCQGKMGFTSVWYFLMSIKEEAGLGLDFLLLLVTSSCCMWNSGLGHFVAAVGGAGWLFTGIAVALLANSTGGYSVSFTVSMLMSQGGGAMVEETSSSGISSVCGSGSGLAGWASSEEVGGFSCKSCTSSNIVASRCSAFNLSTVFSSSREVTPEGVRSVPSEASQGGSCRVRR